MYFFLIKGCQLFRNFMYDATTYNSFDFVQTAVNEVLMRMLFILDDIFVFM